MTSDQFLAKITEMRFCAQAILTNQVIIWNNFIYTNFITKFIEIVSDRLINQIHKKVMQISIH